MPLPLLLALAAAPAALPACTAAQMSVATDAENGAFDGMSHSGTLLVLRNQGPAACRMPGLPTVTFKGADGKPLTIVRQVPRGMHPGPVVVPVGVAAGAELTAPLRWVSGAVYDHSRCLTARFVAVSIGTGSQQIPFTGTVCGEGAAPVTFEQPVLRTDPTLGG